jgi:hypothetical protein
MYEIGNMEKIIPWKATQITMTKHVATLAVEKIMVVQRSV